MKKISSVILSIILILANLLMVNMLIVPIGNNVAAFAGGDGSAGNPYQIANVTHLQNMSANLSAHYILINDIDCTATSGWNGGLGFSPIGNDTNAGAGGKQGDNFTGSFNGQDYKIFNLTINRSGENYIGLFGYAGTGAKLSNCTINGTIKGYDYTGGLAGFSTVDVLSSSSEVTINGHYRVGGLVGEMTGSTFQDCGFSGQVFGPAYLGGISGKSTNTDYYNCYTTGTILNGDFAGGLVGWVDGGDFDTIWGNGTVDANQNIGGLIGYTDNNGKIINASFNGTIKATSSNTGGIVGFLDSGYTLTYSNSTFDMVGTINVGGIVGNSQGIIDNVNSSGMIKSTGVYIGGLVGTSMSGGKIYNSFSSMFINCTFADWVGGVIGRNWGVMNNTYSTGTVIGDQYVGGIAGENQITIENSNFYGSVKGITNDIGGIVGRAIVGGLIQKCNNYGYINGSLITGGIIGNLASGIPLNDCNNYGTVEGTNTVGGAVGYSAGAITNCTSSANVKGTANSIGGLIGENAGGSVLECKAYGNTSGTGASSGNIGGLIGWVNGGTVTSCTADVYVTGTDNDVGGLIGQNDGTVTNCVAYGTANSTDLNVGGLIGYHTGTVTNSTAWGDAISLTNFIGGLIGTNDATVTNCTAYGNAIGNGAGSEYVGGLIGESWGPVSFCKAYGSSSGTGDYIGGLIGNNEGASVTNCTAFGDTDGAGGNSQYTGGLLGWNEGGKVINCSAYGITNGTGWEVAGLVGENTATGVVTNSHAYGDVNGWRLNGGLIAYNSGTVTDCTASGSVIGTEDYQGGLIGYADGGTITNCIAYGSVNGTGATSDYVGGLIGQIISSVPVTNCTAYGDTTGTGDYIGGLIGNTDGPVANCTAYGDTNGTGEYIGGLIGWNKGGGQITNCTAYGNASGHSEVGGLIGWNDGGTVTSCTAYGNATGSGDWIGGLIGFNDFNGKVTNCTAYGNATGDYNVGGLIGLNFVLVSNCTAYGDATGTDEVGGLIGWNEGGGQITNCTAYGNAAGGDLIGGLVGINKGTVTICTAFGDVTGDQDSIGGLIGYNEGTATNCTAFGDVTSTSAAGDGIGGLIGWNDGGSVNNCTAYGNAIGIWGFIGGLIGANFAGGTVTICRAFGDAIGTGLDSDCIGGLIGMVYSGTIENCYAHGDVTGDDEVGGLIGNNSGATVKNCYSIGLVTGDVNASGLIGANDGTVSSCYWDNVTSGHTTSDGGTGKNTTEMQQASTFTGAGWDFTNIWAIKEDFTYPFFGWNYWIDPPILTTIDKQIALEDVLYFVIYQAVDPDYEVLSWNGTTNASWLTFDTNTQLLSGTPTQADIGSYWVHIIVEDPNGLTDETNFTITVLNMNDAPIITTVDVETTNEDELYSVDYNATDIDPTNDLLTWSLSTNADWLTINPATGILSGTPNNTQVGSFWVNVTVDDGNNGNHSTNFTLTVLNVNDDPTITLPQPPYPGAVEDTLYYLDFEADDIDPTGDILIWHLTTDAVWLEIDDVTGILSGTPSNADATITFDVNVTVTDGNDGSATRLFTVYVANLNDAPSITTTDVETAPEDELYSVIYNSTDIDPTDDVLTWTLNTEAEWLDIDTATGNLSGTPTNDDVGTYWVNVSVDDGNMGTDWHNFTLTVTNVNDDPVITTTDVTTAIADDLYSVDYNATDIDPTNDVLTWTVVTGANWLSIDASTGVLSGTPANDDAGDHAVSVTVSDGNGGSDLNSFTLTVEPSGIANLNPNITTANDLTATVHELYFITYEATDDHTLPADLVWTMSTDAGWLDFNGATRVLSGTPAAADVGSYWVLITVDDGEGGSASTNFTVTVSEGPTNTNPDITQGTITPISGDTETTFTFSIHYTDTDGDAPTSIKVVIDGTEYDMSLASGDAADGTYEYETTLTEGTHEYYFEANDGTFDAITTDGTPITATDALTTTEITVPTEPEDEEDDGLFSGMTLWLVLIIVIVVIVVLLAMAMRKKPTEEEALLAAEEEEVIAEEMAVEEELVEDEGADEDEDEEEIETFECPTCGAEIAEDDTVCPECGEEFDDE